MKIPAFEEIILSRLDFSDNGNYLKSEFEKSRVGKVPVYINLTTVSKSDLNVLVMALEKTFIELKLHTRFPYPTYLISEHPVDSIFPVVLSTKELPEHFFKKIKRPNNKELQLLNKLGLTVDKLTNFDRNKILDQFIETSLPQRKLYELSKELYFLETIYKQLNERQNEKQKK
jgi:hypothetical protein